MAGGKGGRGGADFFFSPLPFFTPLFFFFFLPRSLRQVGPGAVPAGLRQEGRAAPSRPGAVPSSAAALGEGGGREQL